MRTRTASTTLTVRNLPASVVAGLKRLARRHQRSMEQEIRQILLDRVGDRTSAIEQIEAAWKTQSRRPRAVEVDRWIRQSRP